MQHVLVLKDERFAEHLEGIPHLETPKRVRAFHEILEDPSLEGKWLEVTPREASLEELALVHTPEHIKRVAQTAEKKLTSFDLDTQATEKSFEVARLAVGGVFNLLDLVCKGEAKRGFACVRPPGHHAEPDRAMGFCLFNNIALGARYIMQSHAMEKVMIVDIDLHHGNGTQSAFYDTNEVLYVSTHQFPCFPGTGNVGEVGRGKGEGFTVNIPLGKGRGDRLFPKIMYSFISRLAESYRPSMILVSCGFDLYMYDRVGDMLVSPEGYGLMTFFLLDIAEKICDGRIVFVMEGGYNLKGIRECGLRVMKELCDVPTLTGEKIGRITKSSADKMGELRKVIEVQKKYWKVFD
jgi:acetoin utilization deacetylase AcuC-like enzyme